MELWMNIKKNKQMIERKEGRRSGRVREDTTAPREM
jgi:hypothetical protein